MRWRCTRLVKEAMPRAIRIAQASSARFGRDAPMGALGLFVLAGWSQGTARNYIKVSYHLHAVIIVLVHAQKITLADFHAVMAKDAVSDCSVKVEIWEYKSVEEFLALQRDVLVGTGRK